MKVFLAPPGDPEPGFESNPIAIIDFAEGGTYFFLYRYLLRIRDDTGQIIENCGFAHFEMAQVDRGLHDLTAARKAAHLKAEVFEQHVGRQVTPMQRDLYETVARSALLDTIDQLANAFRKGKDLGMDVYCVSE